MPSIPNIHVRQQAAHIGIDTTYAKVEIVNIPRPKMRILKEPPRMEIERRAPALSVKAQRQRPPKISDSIRAIAPGFAPRIKTMQPATDSILKTAKSPGPKIDGLSLNAYALELNKALNSYTGYTAKDTIQYSAPSLEWEAGYIDITWSNAQMKIEWEHGNYMPTFSVEPHSVEIYLRQKPYIKITVSEEVINAMYGPCLDEEA